MKKFMIENDVFGFKLLVYYSNKSNEFKKEYDKIWIWWSRYWDAKSYDWFTYYDDKLWVMHMFLHRKSMHVIAHEVIHVVHRLLEERW